MRREFFRGLACLVLLSAAGCDQGEPTGPAARPGAVRPRLSQSLWSAAASIRIPETNGYQYGQVDWYSTGLTVPRNMWVRLRVAGTVNLAHNPTHAAVYCPSGTTGAGCPPPYVGKSVGPLGIDGNLRVHVAVGSPVNYWSPAASAGATDAAEDVKWATAGSVIHATRGGVAGYSHCYLCNPQKEYQGYYAMSGSQTLTVEEVIPLTVQVQPRRVRPGEPVTAVATVHPQVTDLRWYFAAADTGDQPQASTYAGTPIGATCDGQKTCTFSPATSGRVYVSGLLKSQRVYASSELVWVRDCGMFKNPQSDSLLLDPDFQNSLERLWKKTRYHDQLSNRSEQGGLVVKKDGRVELMESGAPPEMPVPKDLCNIGNWPDADTHYTNLGYDVLARIHTHPVSSGRHANPGNCARFPNPPYSHLEFRDKPSPADLTNWRNGSKSYPGYLLDENHLHRWERSGPGGGTPIQNTIDLNKGANACLK